MQHYLRKEDKVFKNKGPGQSTHNVLASKSYLAKNKECIKTATPSDILSILHMYTLLGRTSQKEREIKKKENAQKHTHASMKKCGTYNVEAATYPRSHGVQSKKNDEWQKAVPM